MTPTDALREVLARVGANRGAPVFIGARELSEWPAETVALMKAWKLLAKASPSRSVVCPGCERQCVMPVNLISRNDTAAATFVVCDKRNDINRVTVLASDLEQWQATGDAVADLLAAILQVHRSPIGTPVAGRWEVGLLKHASTGGYLRLLSDGVLRVSVGGHSLVLSDLLGARGTELTVDRRRLEFCLEHPKAGGDDDIETAEQRRTRLRRRLAEEKARGGPYLRRVAKEEGVTPGRIKQILKPKPTRTEPIPAKKGRR